MQSSQKGFIVHKLRRAPRYIMAFKIMVVFLSVFYLYSTAGAFDVLLQWDPNTEDHLAGYKIYYGTASRQYDTVIDIGKSESVSISGLGANTPYFFAVTAYDSAKNESAYSNEINHTIADIDNDGLPDSWEYKYSLNASSNDAAADHDRDGYTNLQEFRARSDPRDFASCPDGACTALLQMILAIMGN